MTGCCASQSICSPGMQPAQFIGDGLVPAGVPEPDRGGDIQSTLGAAADAAVPRLGGVGVSALSAATNSRISRFTLTGSRACGA